MLLPGENNILNQAFEVKGHTSLSELYDSYIDLKEEHALNERNSSETLVPYFSSLIELEISGESEFSHPNEHELLKVQVREDDEMVATPYELALRLLAVSYAYPAVVDENLDRLESQFVRDGFWCIGMWHGETDGSSGGDRITVRTDSHLAYVLTLQKLGKHEKAAESLELLRSIPGLFQQDAGMWMEGFAKKNLEYSTNRASISGIATPRIMEALLELERGNTSKGDKIISDLRGTVYFDPSDETWHEVDRDGYFRHKTLTQTSLVSYSANFLELYYKIRRAKMESPAPRESIFRPATLAF